MLVCNAGKIILPLIVLFLPTIGVSGDVPSDDQSPSAGKITVVEQTGKRLPLAARFVDEDGNDVTIGSLIDKPTILLPIYFTCPNSCSINLANLAQAMQRMKLRAGRDYRAIALSFDDRETPDDARRAKRNYLKLLDEDFPEDQWRFVTGSRQSIDAVLDAIGFSYKALADGTFIHPSMLAVLGEDGTIIKYVYGTFIAGDVELGVAEAVKGVPATSIKRFLDYCFNYDPAAGGSVFQTVKLLILAAFGAGLVFFFVRFLRHKGAGERRG